MKYKLLFLLFLLEIGLNSCNSISSVVFNANSKKKFNTQEVYLQKLFDSDKYPKEKIIFLSNSELSLLMNDIVDKHLLTYYGIVDSSSFVSADQLTVKSCQGQIATL